MPILAEQIIEKYGLASFAIICVLFFSAKIVLKIVDHFIKTIEIKDVQFSAVSEKFIDALEKNSEAIKEFNETQTKVVLAIDRIIENIDHMADQNHDDHKQILQLVQRRSIQ